MSPNTLVIIIIMFKGLTVLITDRYQSSV